MDGVLSQEEINALLNDTGGGSLDMEEETLNDEEKDAIGEISNISMGTAATTLFSLVNRKVEISTPVVDFCTWNDIVHKYEKPCVFIRIAYTVGLNGSNILVLKENDVKIITDLMMGGDGTNTEGELEELHLSAISEAMNQMMGSSATSLSSMLNKMIDISPPIADLVDLSEDMDGENIDEFLGGRFVKISFRMEIGNLVDSEIMQLYPFAFAKEMYNSIAKNMNIDIHSARNEKLEAEKQEEAKKQASAPQQGQPMYQQPMGQQSMGQQSMGQQSMGQQPMYQQSMGQQSMGQPMMGQPMNYQNMQQPINVQSAQFQNFNSDFVAANQRENIDLIMDVPLEVTVELGRTSKSIKDILEFAPGTIVELNKVAGEPIDILVNGKYVAKGEVVVIEENFGIRITEIIKN